MKKSLQSGFTFGLTSGVITTLGLMTGLESGTNSRLAVIGGILTIAVADACSDALGVHISAEAEGTNTEKQVWAATLSTFVAKFLMAMTFVIPVMIFELFPAILVSVAWGMIVLTLLSFRIARVQGVRPCLVIGEHLAIAAAVILTTHYLGLWIARTFQ